MHARKISAAAVFPRLDFASHTSSDQGKLLMNKEQFFDESEKKMILNFTGAFLGCVKGANGEILI